MFAEDVDVVFDVKRSLIMSFGSPVLCWYGKNKNI